MKKNLKRILGMLFTLILVYQNICYADVISIPDLERTSRLPMFYWLGFITVIILLISSVTFLTLKIIEKNKQINANDGSENTNHTKMIKQTLNKGIYIYKMIIAIFALINLIIFYEPNIELIISIVALLAVSLLTRLLKNKNVSIIISMIALFIAIIAIIYPDASEKIADNYNKKFNEIKYTNVNEIINTAIENNKFGRKTAIVYNNSRYKSPKELEQLLNDIENPNNYITVKKYDKNRKYIDEIELINKNLEFFLEYYGKTNIKGFYIKSFISKIKSKVLEDNISITILYKENSTQKAINIESQTIKNADEIWKVIKSGSSYNIDIQSDAIVITKIN